MSAIHAALGELRRQRQDLDIAIEVLERLVSGSKPVPRPDPIPAPELPVLTHAQRQRREPKPAPAEGLHEPTLGRRTGPAPAIDPQRILTALTLSSEGMTVADIARSCVGKTAATENVINALRQQLYRMDERGEVRREGRFYFRKAEAES